MLNLIWAAKAVRFVETSSLEIETSQDHPNTGLASLNAYEKFVPIEEFSAAHIRQGIIWANIKIEFAVLMSIRI